MKTILFLLVAFFIFDRPALAQDGYDSCIVGISGLTIDEYDSH